MKNEEIITELSVRFKLDPKMSCVCKWVSTDSIADIFGKGHTPRRQSLIYINNDLYRQNGTWIHAP